MKVFAFLMRLFALHLLLLISATAEAIPQVGDPCDPPVDGNNYCTTENTPNLKCRGKEGTRTCRCRYSWYSVPGADPPCYEGLLGDLCNKAGNCDTANAICTPVAAGPSVCTCPDGYQPDDQECIPETIGCDKACDGFGDICENPSPEPTGHNYCKMQSPNLRCKGPTGSKTCKCRSYWYHVTGVSPPCYEGLIGDLCNTAANCDTPDAICAPVASGDPSVCTCPSGYQPNNQVCVAESWCPSGYEEDEDGLCVDIDECVLSTDGCEHVCANTEGSFKCSCNDGYTLNLDHKTCSPDGPQTETPVVSCDDAYAAESPTHTLCMKRSDDFIEALNVDPDFIVSEHNKYRSAVNPTAKNMQKMVWDTDLAAIAQAWSEQCIREHDSNQETQETTRYLIGAGPPPGQNGAFNSINWEAVVRMWHSEVDDYTYGKLDADLYGIGHYTQVVHARTSRVGCGAALCYYGEPDPIFKAIPRSKHYFCNYFAGQNTLSRPYESGDTCEDCPSSCDDDGLCDCEGLYCYNSGTLDPDSCKCNCRTGFKLPDCREAV